MTQSEKDFIASIALVQLRCIQEMIRTRTDKDMPNVARKHAEREIEQLRQTIKTPIGDIAMIEIPEPWHSCITGWQERCEQAESTVCSLREALETTKEFIENQQLPDAEWSRVLDVCVKALRQR